ncbi:hypothetical protein CYLTODRAFT_229574 [Cylindrobasidium torrendii FP15055 ss-10]|uniref:Uncharacterized protein n=1 Tax=Cylindrobasidium torrendii FP15055 ss-10 TaxID=1314674 RepID=A0A0D7ASJ2_9AGAR|nr:hypothetical protein CYLTODRAFT_229574 [Cylindrobasidium torrendii FP15055 ss-10]
MVSLTPTHCAKDKTRRVQPQILHPQTLRLPQVLPLRLRLRARLRNHPNQARNPLQPRPQGPLHRHQRLALQHHLLARHRPQVARRQPHHRALAPQLPRPRPHPHPVAWVWVPLWELSSVLYSSYLCFQYFSRYGVGISMLRVSDPADRCMFPLRTTKRPIPRLSNRC